MGGGTTLALPTCQCAPGLCTHLRMGSSPLSSPHTSARDPQPLACHPVGFLEIWGVRLWGKGGRWGLGTKTCTVCVALTRKAVATPWVGISSDLPARGRTWGKTVEGQGASGLN